MRKLIGSLLCGAALIALWGSRPAEAQITLGFVNPNWIDPPVVLTFTNVDLAVTSNGAALIPDSGFRDGTELHAAIPGGHGGLLDVNQVIMTFTYNGDIMVQTSADGPFAPWVHTESVDPNTHLWTVIYSRTPAGAAPINENFDPGGPFHHSFAGLSISSTNPNFLTDFANQNPNNDSVMYRVGDTGIERGSVPEPGTLALLGALGVGGGVFFARRRRNLRKPAVDPGSPRF